MTEEPVETCRLIALVRAALELADEQQDTLVAALLADCLHKIESRGAY
jgi:DNA-binding ferritin-like protein